MRMAVVTLAVAGCTAGGPVANSAEDTASSNLDDSGVHDDTGAGDGPGENRYSVDCSKLPPPEMPSEGYIRDPSQVLPTAIYGQAVQVSIDGYHFDPDNPPDLLATYIRYSDEFLDWLDQQGLPAPSFGVEWWTTDHWFDEQGRVVTWCRYVAICRDPCDPEVVWNNGSPQHEKLYGWAIDPIELIVRP